MPIPGNRRWPMVRVFIPFALGIIIGFYSDIRQWVIVAGFIFFLLSIFCYDFVPTEQQFRIRLITGYLMFGLLCFAGMLILFLSQPEHKKSWWGNSTYTTGIVTARFLENAKVGAKAFSGPAELLAVQTESGLHRITGKVVISILKADGSKPFLAGQGIAFRKLPTSIRNTSNPGGFDYKRYMYLQEIMHQVFLVQNEFQLLEVKRSGFHRMLDWLQQYVLDAIRNNIPGREEAGLAEALLIGYRNDLDRDLIQSYSNTGVVHVIAISGLHLALIYLLLGKLCDLLKIKHKFVKPLIVIAGLWIFALLAGGSPSVVRSAVMFSVIVAGELINRKAHILNSLAASAFILLCYNPLWLWDLGFQLSYIAVLSLALTATPIYQWIYIRNPMLDNLWKLVSVTISAQILTTPISLLNFHKFPVMFLFTNCICVPLSSLILLGELMLCVVAPLRPLSVVIGKLLRYALTFMNDVVRYFEHYPISNFQPVQISIIQALLLYAFIALAFIHFKKPSANLRIAVGLTLTAFSVLRLASFDAASKQSKIVVYNLPGSMLTDVFTGRQAIEFQLSDTVAPSNAIAQYATPSRIIHRIDQHYIKRISIGRNEIREINGLMVYFSSAKDTFHHDTIRAIDIMIISHNSIYRSFRQLAGLKLRLVVADATNSRAAVQSYQAFFYKIGVPFHAVSLQGAFVRNLN